MKTKYIILLSVLFSFITYSQTYNPLIETIMNKTNLDSLVSYVRILSGEDSCKILDAKFIIKTRGMDSINDLAADYLKHKLKSFNLETFDQKYSTVGRNIYAVQKGKLYPDKYFIYCAHYDAVTDYCADDNASGTAGVLEAARILSEYEMDYSIIYAFWDQEEIGGLGSKFFALQADSLKMQVEGVLNFEMSGWDSDDDGLVDVHSGTIPKSIDMANLLVAVDSLYNLPLNPIVYTPGTGASDHSSFWKYEFPAICFSEAFYGRDFNPYYHSNEDRIEHFNLPYFHNVAKLGLGSLVTLTLNDEVTSVNRLSELPNTFKINNYPNPFNNSTIIEYEVPEEGYITMELYNSLGQKLSTLYKGHKTIGKHKIHYNSNKLSTGVYFLRFYSQGKINLHKMILLK